MIKLETEWINEIHKSRLVILPGEGSYLSGVDVPVWKLIHQVANGAGLSYKKFPRQIQSFSQGIEGEIDRITSILEETY